MGEQVGERSVLFGNQKEGGGEVSLLRMTERVMGSWADELFAVTPDVFFL